MKNLLNIILFFTFLTIIFGKFPMNNEKKLIKNLLKLNYGKYARPVKNETDGITVNFVINLLQIVDIVTTSFKINF